MPLAQVIEPERDFRTESERIIGKAEIEPLVIGVIAITLIEVLIGPGSVICAVAVNVPRVSGMFQFNDPFSPCIVGINGIRSVFSLYSIEQPNFVWNLGGFSLPCVIVQIVTPVHPCIFTNLHVSTLSCTQPYRDEISRLFFCSATNHLAPST